VEEGARHVLAGWRAGRSDAELVDELVRAGLSSRAARRDDRSAFRDLARTGPVWGVRWEVRF
jgi:hypothetical protein